MKARAGFAVVAEKLEKRLGEVKYKSRRNLGGKLLTEAQKIIFNLQAKKTVNSGVFFFGQ